MKLLRRALPLLLLFVLLLAQHAGASGKKRLTLMVYMCGSNLESGYGSATADIQEILSSGFDVDSVSVLIMTGGSNHWSMGYDPAQIYISEVGKRGMRAVWHSDSMSMGEPETLTQLLSYGMENHPAEEYALILWDHGGGPLEGVCWDEIFSMDCLSLNELVRALDDAALPRKLSWIGFDACLMSSAEVAAALSPYASYMIASQETEPAKGWNYSFLEGIGSDESGAETGRRIVDAYFEGLEDSGDILTLACLDLSKTDAMIEAMDKVFAPISESMDAESFIRLSGMRMSSTGFGKAVRAVGEDGYDLVDLGDLISRYGQDAQALKAAIDEAVVYSRSSEEGAGGLSVYHPFVNKRKYEESWRKDYAALPFSKGYVAYLNAFGSLLTGAELAEWTSLTASDAGLDEQDNNLFSLQLTPEQANSFASAQLIVLANPFADSSDIPCAPVAISPAVLDENGLLTASYAGQTLYMTNDAGQVLCGPISYQLADDGTCLILAHYWNGDIFSALLDDMSAHSAVLYNCAPSESDPDELVVVRTRVWDEATETYTNRIAFAEENYQTMGVSYLLRKLPQAEGVLPAFSEWEDYGADGFAMETITLPCRWHLRFFDTQQSGAQFRAIFEVTDVQQNSYCSPPVPVENHNLTDVAVEPRVITDDLEATLSVSIDESLLSPCVRMRLNVVNRSGGELRVSCSRLVLNGTRSVNDSWRMDPIEPGESGEALIVVPTIDLTDFEAITTADCMMTARWPDGSDEDIPLHFSLRDADVRAIAPRSGTVLAEAESPNILCRLYALSAVEDGSLEGSLLIRNKTEQELSLGSAVLMADGVATHTSWNVSTITPSIAAQTEAWMPFTYHNKIEIMPLDVSPGGYMNPFSVLTGEDHLAEHAGREAVHSLDLALMYDSGAGVYRDRVSLPLSTPLALNPVRDRWPLLAEGDVSVRINSLAVGSHGISLIAEIRNDTDDDLSLTLPDSTLNGSPDAAHTYWTCSLPARAVVFSEIKLTYSESFQPDEGVSELGLLFKYGDASCGPCLIRMREPAKPASGEAVCLQALAGDFGIAPAAFRTLAQPIPIDPATVTEEAFTADMAVDLVESEDGNPKLRLTMKITNLTDGDFALTTDQYVGVAVKDIMLNDTRCTNAVMNCFMLEHGAQENLSVCIEPHDLMGLERIDSLSCLVSIAISEGNIVQYPLRFTLADAGIPTPALPEPMTQAEGAGGVWQLLGLSQDESGDFHALLRVENRGEAMEFANSAVLLNGIGIGGAFSLSVPSESDRIFPMTINDDILVSSYLLPVSGNDSLDVTLADRVLERQGTDSISELRLLLGYNLDELAYDHVLSLTLKEPAALNGAIPPHEGNEGSAALVEGAVSADVKALLLGDDRIGVVLELRNDTDEDNLLVLWDVLADGWSARPYGTWNRYNIIPAHSVIEKGIVLSTEESLSPGDTVRRIVFSLQVLGMDRADVTLLLPEGARLGVEHGLLLDGAQLESQPAAFK